MKKNVFGRQFKRDTNERKALFKNLLTSLVLNGRIKTTTAKAKAIKAAADKLVTKAKKDSSVATRLLEADVNHDAVVKLIEVIAPLFANRNGGYTRVIKIGNRIADNAEMSLIEWTEQPVKVEVVKEPNVTKGKETKKVEPKTEKVKKTTKKEEKPKKKTKESKEKKK